MEHEISTHMANIYGRCDFDFTTNGEALVIVGKDCSLKVA